MNKTNRRPEFQFYWYCDSTCFRQPFCPSSGVLSRTSVLVNFMQFWWPGAGWNCSSILLLVTNGHHNCIKCNRTPDDGQKGCPKHRVVILIKVEISASVGFIHKESVMIHGHTILKCKIVISIRLDTYFYVFTVCLFVYNLVGLKITITGGKILQ